MVAVPVPDAGETVHQAASLEAVQAQEVVNTKVVEPAEEATDREVGDTVNAQAACVTTTLTGLRPGTVIVMVADLLEQVVLVV